MKRIITLTTIFIIFVMAVSSCAVFSKTELNFKTIENKENEDFDLYLLLPRDYIEFAILNSASGIDYEGPSTLKENDIPGIEIDNKENIQDEPYNEDEIEYVQILLEKSDDGSYKFDIIDEYPDLSMKYRIKNDEKDYIVHIDNFKVKNRVCEIEYDYTTDSIKQPDEVMTQTAVILCIILSVIVVIGLIAYFKQRS